MQRQYGEDEDKGAKEKKQSRIGRARYDNNIVSSGNITAHAFRLKPGASLMTSLKATAEEIFEKHSVKSAFLMTAVGSLSSTTLRMANAASHCKTNPVISWTDERFEIVSMEATFSPGGKCHVHISLSRHDGSVIGGHLIDGIVFTTCEIVLGSIDQVIFDRVMDDETGYTELVIRDTTSARHELELNNNCS